MTQEITYTKRLYPEDIVPGSYVAIAGKVHEIFPLWLIGCIPGESVQKIRVTCLDCADGDPRRVLAACIPFVLTEDAKGRIETLDIRQHILVRVDEMYALEMFTRPGKACVCCRD